MGKYRCIGLKRTACKTVECTPLSHILKLLLKIDQVEKQSVIERH